MRFSDMRTDLTRGSGRHILDIQKTIRLIYWPFRNQGKVSGEVKTYVPGGCHLSNHEGFQDTDIWYRRGLDKERMFEYYCNRPLPERATRKCQGEQRRQREADTDNLGGPLPCSPEAETAIQPQIWCLQSYWISGLSSNLEECFCQTPAWRCGDIGAAATSMFSGHASGMVSYEYVS